MVFHPLIKVFERTKINMRKIQIKSSSLAHLSKNYCGVGVGVGVVVGVGEGSQLGSEFTPETEENV